MLYLPESESIEGWVGNWGSTIHQRFGELTLGVRSRYRCRYKVCG
jgi:hypothetical protein